MKILILGVSGYIGQHLTEYLQKNQNQVFGLDLKKTSKISEQNFLQGDVRLKTDLEKAILLFEPDTIIDLAALAEVGPEYNLTDYDSNYSTPSLLAKICKKKKPKLKNIIFTSTQYVIGPQFSGRNILGYGPHTTYGQSKVILEQEIFNNFGSFEKSGIDVSIVRPTNVWGGNHPKYSNMWEKLLQKNLVAIPRKKILKSYCHISTLVELYESLLNVRTYKSSFSDIIVYGSDHLCGQNQWVDLQVEGLNKIGIKAGYWKTPVWVLRAISLLLSAIGNRNPLPASRVNSMLINYEVDLSREDSLAQPKSLEQLQTIVNQDVEARYS